MNARLEREFILENIATKVRRWVMADATSGVRSEPHLQELRKAHSELVKFERKLRRRAA